MNETILGLLGLAMMYTWVHFTIVQHTKNYKERTGYERFITWFAIVTLTLVIIGSLS